MFPLKTDFVISKFNHSWSLDFGSNSELPNQLIRQVCLSFITAVYPVMAEALGLGAWIILIDTKPSIDCNTV